jgi:hypothetical protein
MGPIPPPPPVWKTIVLPGLLCGLLLTLIQVVIIILGSNLSSGLGFPFLPHSTPATFFFLLFFYLVIPALPALLVTSWTRQPFLGYRAGRLAGVSCAVILILATLTYPLPTLDTATGARLTPIAGLAAANTVVSRALLSVLYHIVGVLLAMLGAFLGSRTGRRAFSPEEKRGRG